MIYPEADLDDDDLDDLAGQTAEGDQVCSGGFTAPRSVEFREELPLGATGKVMKDHLR
ncbi:hypothetical protein [Streptomyces griseorubiginosus]|uniref:hypothetical protein n=1 Tax=Streptomyces griseorubiginosus TaxID=67304 RepID=UPI001AD67438|nr:hypothetical protein [Streptomyces griseorubiginosus]MBO4258731.1 hypothetical protein [Streptomyces griseorubiginosus]